MGALVCPARARWLRCRRRDEAVEALGRVDEDDRRGGVGLARGEAHLARARAARRRRGPRRGMPAPSGSARRGARGCRSTRRAPPRPRRCGSRTRACPTVEQQGGVVAGAAAARRAQVGAVGRGGCAAATRSRHQRPVRSSTSSARDGSGSIARRRPSVERRRCRRSCWSPTASTRSTPCSSRACRSSRRVAVRASSRASTTPSPQASQSRRATARRRRPAGAVAGIRRACPSQPSAAPGSTVRGHGSSRALWRHRPGDEQREGRPRHRQGGRRPSGAPGQPGPPGGLEHERGPGGPRGRARSADVIPWWRRASGRRRTASAARRR